MLAGGGESCADIDALAAGADRPIFTGCVRTPRFEEFARVALRAELGLSARQFPGPNQTTLHLDDRRRIGLDPDLSWWEGRHCRFVGDVTYTRLTFSGIKHPDLYQLLAYVLATDLPGGLLVDPVAERAHEAEHVVVNLGRRLEVVTVDVS